ncbi:MAG TPA: PilZ domain-containing protein [Lacipirellulaceae bacterium]|jgi:hypothetical protein|nr:PilZ domain-containing protein [Lacipirellulaceae bacterium]
MLELDHGQDMMEELWQATTAKVALSVSLKQEFFKVHGAAPIYYDNRRTYHRYFMRGKAVLRRGETQIGTYTKDVSRQGVGFLSPVPLMPKERVKLRVPAAELSLEVTRCRRIEAACFECGAKFSL